MKEMTNVASTVMSEEEKAELDRDIKASHAQSTGNGTPTVEPATPDAATVSPSPPADIPVSASDGISGLAPAPEDISHSLSPSTSPSPLDSPKSPNAADDLRKKKGKQKVTAEQRQKLDEIEKERRKAMEARVKMLTEKLIERIRPFVDAQHPGDPNDPETVAFQEKMLREADDLKLESFGVEVFISFSFHFPGRSCVI